MNQTVFGLLGAAAAASITIAAPAAMAGRSLNEPPAIKAIPRMVPAPKQTQALKAAGLTERCGGAALRNQALNGFGCRLSVHAYLTAQQPVDSLDALNRRLEMAQQALKAADNIAHYEPLTKKPGLKRRKAWAHEQACRAVLQTYDAVNATAGGDPALREAARRAVKAKGSGLFDMACRCARDSVALGSEAEVPMSDMGRLQAQLTSRGCFLDRTALKSDRGGPKEEFSENQRKSVADRSATAQLLSYAEVRDVDFNRCRIKGKDDRAKLEKCACSVMKRWRFPKERGRKNLQLTVPVLKGTTGIRVEVNAAGKTLACGPLQDL